MPNQREALPPATIRVRGVAPPYVPFATAVGLLGTQLATDALPHGSTTLTTAAPHPAVAPHLDMR
jgi:hypothetical protein